MRFRSTWILFALLVVVAAYFVLVERRRAGGGGDSGAASGTLLPYGKDEVERIVLVNPEKERIVLQRRGEPGWMITAPVTTEAADETIDVLLMQLVPGTRLEEFRDVPNPGDFGFDDPFATVILWARDRPGPDTIMVGDTAPTGPRCYVRLDRSREIVVTRELTHGAVDKDLYDLRDKNLLDIDIDEIDRLTVTNGASRVELAREGNEWRFAGSGLPADRLLIERYLAMVTTAIIHAFVREDLTDLAPFGLVNPRREITIGAGRERISILFGASDARMVYVVRSGIDKVLQVPAGLLSIFAAQPASFRAKELTVVDEETVRELSAESAGRTIVLAKEKAAWRRVAPDSAAVPSAAVEALLGALLSTRFEELFDPAAAPPAVREGAPAITLILRDGSGRVLDQILVAVSTSGFEFGTSTSAAAAGRLKEGTIGKISGLLARLGG